tara:strand:- start:1633 stop:3000 length:1368 start_codon:yes stop_codon:yes gene_type:complete
VSNLLKDADYAIKNNEIEFGLTCVLEHMHEYPNDVASYIMLCRGFIDGGKAPFAYPIAKQAVAQKKNWNTLMMLGAVEQQLQLEKQAVKTLERALKLMPQNEAPHNFAILYRLLAGVHVQMFKFDKAEYYAKKSLQIEQHAQAHVSYAFAKLHKRQWAEGWYHYKFHLGHVDDRKKHNYSLPEWNGEKDVDVMVYAEQGIGDQLAYMSACPVIPKQINCHPKLEKLFKRTFKHSEVFGQQFASVFKEKVTATHQTSMATMMQFSEMKSRSGYLKTDNDKDIMWSALFEKLSDKPKIGIAWTGGKVSSSGYRSRKLSLEQLTPLLEQPYTFINLQYKDSSEEIEEYYKKTGIKIHDYSWATLSNDYDETASLVNNLDAVVCVPTSIYHLAGALSKPCFVAVHNTPHWHEGLEGDSPWYQSVEFFRRKDFGTKKTIELIIKRLESKFFSKAALKGVA